MKKVFISYATEDRAVAQRVYDALTSIKINCWMAPQSISAGADYTTEIPRGIKQCQAFVLILSKHSQESLWVKKEVNVAINSKKLIYVIKIDDSELNESFEFSLTDIQLSSYNDNLELLAKHLDDMVEPLSDDEGEQDYGYAQTSMSEEKYFDIINNASNREDNKNNHISIVDKRRKAVSTIIMTVCLVLMIASAVLLAVTLIGDFAGDNNSASASDAVQLPGQTSFMLNTISFTGTYTGNLNDNGRADGLGQFSGKSEKNTDATYVGDFKEGLVTGKGTAKLNYADGRIMEITGEFKNGLPEGKCSVRTIKADGEEHYFEGYYSKGYANGEGVRTVTKVNGDVHTYEGTFKNGNPDGMLRETVVCANGDIKEYYGEFSKNNWNGKISVSAQYARGAKSTFEGTCVNGDYEGEAVYIYESEEGDIVEYTGDYSKNKKNGKGVIKTTQTDGTKTIYTGDFVDNQKQGNGEFIKFYPDGTRIEVKGAFANDMSADNTPYTKYDADGNVIETGVMIDDMPVKQ